MNPKIVAGVALASLALTACAGAKPEPEIRIQRVVIEKAVPCIPANLGEAQPYPDTEAALRNARDLAERYLLLWAGRELRAARLGETEPVIAACREVGNE